MGANHQPGEHVGLEFSADAARAEPRLGDQAIRAGMVKPKRRSSGSIVFDMIVVATSVVTIFIRSPARTSTLSAWPEATL